MHINEDLYSNRALYSFKLIHSRNAICCLLLAITLYWTEQAWKFLQISDQQEPVLHFSKFESCKSLGKKLIYSSPLRFMIQKNYDSKTSEFMLHSFRAFQRYRTNKSPTHSRGTVSISQFSTYSFWTYFRSRSNKWFFEELLYFLFSCIYLCVTERNEAQYSLKNFCW